MVYTTLQAFPNKKACDFCQTRIVNPLTLGNIYKTGDIIVHYFCLLLASKGVQRGTDRQGLLGFFIKDIKSELKRGSRIKCIYCLKNGATVLCSKAKCKANFHLPCGLKNNSLHYFYNDFRSFCVKHRSKPNVPAQLIEGNSVCILCCNRIKLKNDIYNLVWPPCCKPPSLQHKRCVQQLAYSAGYYFKCPFCNNEKKFNKAMRESGVFIPEQEASWERDPQAYGDFRVELKCYADRSCKCPKGVSYNKDNTKWNLNICKLCGGNAIHLGCCDSLKRNNSSNDWECPDCRIEESHLNEEIDSDIDSFENGSVDSFVTASENFHSSEENEDYKITVGNNSLKDKGTYVLFDGENSTNSSSDNGIVLFVDKSVLNKALMDVTNINEMIINGKRCMINLNKVKIDINNEQELKVNKFDKNNIEIKKLYEVNKPSCSRYSAEMVINNDEKETFVLDNEVLNTTIDKKISNMNRIPTDHHNDDNNNNNKEINIIPQINFSFNLEINQYIDKISNNEMQITDNDNSVYNRNNDKKLNHYNNIPLLKLAKNLLANNTDSNSFKSNYKSFRLSLSKEIWRKGLKRTIQQEINEFNANNNFGKISLYRMLKNSNENLNIKEKFREKLLSFINNNNCIIFSDKTGISYAELFKSFTLENNKLEIVYGFYKGIHSLLDLFNELLIASVEKCKTIIIATPCFLLYEQDEFFTNLLKFINNINCVQLVFCIVPSKIKCNFQSRLYASFNKKLLNYAENFNFKVWNL